MSERTWQIASWWCELADPELTAVYAESQDEKRPASRVLRDGLCHEIVMSFVHHTTDAVQSSLLRSLGFWLSTLLIERPAHGKLVKDAVVLKEYVALQLSVCHSRLGLFLVCQKIAHPLLNLSAGSKGRSARRCQSCFSSFDDVNLETCRSEDTSVGVTILMPAWQRGVSRLIEVHGYHPSTLVQTQKMSPLESHREYRTRQVSTTT